MSSDGGFGGGSGGAAGVGGVAAGGGFAAGGAGGGGADSGRTFEELVAELESLTDRLASGQIGIEEAAQVYERAELLHALASARLAAVQERVEKLSRGVSEEGRGASGG